MQVVVFVIRIKSKAIPGWGLEMCHPTDEPTIPHSGLRLLGVAVQQHVGGPHSHHHSSRDTELEVCPTTVVQYSSIKLIASQDSLQIIRIWNIISGILKGTLLQPVILQMC